MIKPTKEQVIDSLGYPDKIKEKINRQLIFLCISGSHAYGTATENSDVDVRGIFVGDKEEIIGESHIEQYENPTNDTVIYEVRKALHLIAEQNPNMLELLWVDETDIIYATDLYWRIRKQREYLLSSLSRFKFSGYAMSQLKRIRGHNKWLSQEQEGKFETKPELLDYCRIIRTTGATIRDKEILFQFARCTFLTHETETIFKIWESENSSSKSLWISEKSNYEFSFREFKPKDAIFYGILLFSHDEFDTAMKNYIHWEKWKRERNKDRSELEKNFGYDTKHAMHLIRLLRMGMEILRGEGVIIKRPDADFLKQIRNGIWTYEQILSYAEDMDKKCLESEYKITTMRKSVDKDLLNKLIIEIYDEAWS